MFLKPLISYQMFELLPRLKILVAQVKSFLNKLQLTFFSLPYKLVSLHKALTFSFIFPNAFVCPVDLSTDSLTKFLSSFLLPKLKMQQSGKMYFFKLLFRLLYFLLHVFF